MAKQLVTLSVFEKCFSVIDYCGDIASNMNSAESNKYSNAFSPNNVRLLVISPEGALAYLYKSAGDKGKRNRKLWSVQDYARYVAEQSINPKGYQPLIGVLSYERQFSNIEEIILLKNSTRGIELDGRELEVESLIKGYRQNNGDITERIRSRYKRLSRFTVLNMNFSEFVNWFGVNLQSYNDFSLVSDLIPQEYIVPNISVMLNKEPFLNHSYTIQRGTYYLDTNGTLQSHFEEVERKYNQKVKKDKVDDFKKDSKKVSKSILEEEEKQGNTLLNVLKAYNIMGNLLSKYPNYYASYSLQKFDKGSVYGSEFFKKNEVKLGNCFSNVLEEGSEQENAKIFKIVVYRMYISLVDYYITSLDNLNPILVNFLYKQHLLCNINVPTSLSGKVQALEQKYRIQISKDSFNIKDMASLCRCICDLFVTSKGDKDTIQFKTMDYWKNMFVR